MNPERLLQYFERISEAEDAVPRLRRFILDLAVRGKLVKQDPDEESAAELLEHITVEKARLVKEGKIKNPKLLPGGVTEIPFEVPESWVWCSAGHLFELVTSGSRGWSQFYSKDGPIFLRIGNLDYGTTCLDLSNIQHVQPPANSEGTRTRIMPGDILVSITGDTGMVGLIPDGLGEAYINQHIAMCRPMVGSWPKYIAMVFTTQLTLDQLWGYQRGVKNSLGLDDIRNIRFPLPPLAEQHRIVARVDELMTLCDELEAAQAKRETRRDRLVAATLHGLNNGDSTFKQNARFYFTHLPRLTTRIEHVQQLRQTILNLAVRGKLVEQDPADEPATELIKHIQAETKQLVKGGKNNRMTSMSPPKGDDIPFDIPPNWAWVRLGAITFSRDGERIPVSKDDRSRRAKIYDYYGASGVIDKIDGFLFDKPLLLIGEDGANLINRSTPIAFIARGKYWVNNHAHVLDGISEGFLRFIELHINAIDLQPYVTGTAQPKMNQAKMNSIPIALPPLAEQHRIVAKVDELMALCDKLEAQLTTTATTRRRLLEATLHEALAVGT
jgi:type I restriction enzyme S subunit